MKMSQDLIQSVNVVWRNRKLKRVWCITTDVFLSMFLNGRRIVLSSLKAIVLHANLPIAPLLDILAKCQDLVFFNCFVKICRRMHNEATFSTKCILPSKFLDYEAVFRQEIPSYKLWIFYRIFFCKSVINFSIECIFSQYSGSCRRKFNSKYFCKNRKSVFRKCQKVIFIGGNPWYTKLAIQKFSNVVQSWLTLVQIWPRTQTLWDVNLGWIFSKTKHFRRKVWLISSKTIVGKIIAWAARFRIEAITWANSWIDLSPLG